MKKLLYSIFACAFLLAITACGKDDEAGIPDGVYNPGRKISKIYTESIWDGASQGKELLQTWTWNGNQLASIQYAYADEPMVFAYEGNRIASITGENILAIFIYKGKNLQRIEFSHEGEVEIILEILEHQDGHITHIKSTYPLAPAVAGLPGSFDRFHTTVMGILFPSVPVEEPQTKARRLMDNVRFVYQGDNVIRQIMTAALDDESITATYTYTYDDKNNPFYSGLVSELLEPFSSSRNNPLTLQVLAEYSEDVRFNAVAYTYVYDAGWPVQRNQYDAGDSEWVEITYYEYL